jgi:hypothetical protein
MGAQKGCGTGVLAIHTEHDHSELFAFKYFASIAKGCASLPECEALLMQLYVRLVSPHVLAQAQKLIGPPT